MTKADKVILINYRLERAEESLKAAQLMLENKLYVSAMNRIYYAMFYSVQALLVLNDNTFSKHGQVKGFFNREFIKTGVFPKDLGKLFNIVFEYRQKFDYVDLIIPEEKLITDYIVKATKFIEQITKFLKDKMTSL